MTPMMVEPAEGGWASLSLLHTGKLRLGEGSAVLWGTTCEVEGALACGTHPSVDEHPCQG